MGRPLRRDIDIREVMKLYAEGMTATQIGKHLKACQGVILRHMERHDVPRRGRGNFSPIPLQTIKDLYESGLNCGQVGKICGVTRRAVKVRLVKAGIAIRPTIGVRHVGQANSQWKGGRIRSHAGYILINVSPKRRIFEHRLVMEQQLGRPLTKSEIVHHMNGIRDDNRPSNLCITTREDHEHYTYVKRLQQRIRDLEEALKGHEANPH